MNKIYVVCVLHYVYKQADLKMNEIRKYWDRRNLFKHRTVPKIKPHSQNYLGSLERGFPKKVSNVYF